jgi:hypothetical protein
MELQKTKALSTNTMLKTINCTKRSSHGAETQAIAAVQGVKSTAAVLALMPAGWREQHHYKCKNITTA